MAAAVGPVSAGPGTSRHRAAYAVKRRTRQWAQVATPGTTTHVV
ncbi:hypothetical protein [Streptomyces thioluteus]